MPITSRLICGGQELVISVIGPFSREHKHEFLKSYRELTAQPEECTVDLSQTENVDPSAFRLLVLLRKDSERVRIIGCDSQLLQQLKDYRLSHLFEFPQ